MTIAFKDRKPLVLPAAALRRAGFKNGQSLEINVVGGAITIIAKAPSANENTSANRRAIDRGIAASEKDYKEGRSYGPFKTHREFIASLHAESAKLRPNKPKRAGK
jgi:bifunctional DNA-binding transcriptional regulator/antitoxin component of YhaV-PrlF toxin-antitoxin module